MEEQERIERTAKTVEEAIEIALLELGAGRAEVEVDVLSKGRSGILGIGAEPARVRVTRIGHDAGKAGVALNTVSRILKAMEVEAHPTIVNSGTGPDNPAVISIEGVDAGLLIGRRGDTLQALQFIINLLVARQENEKTWVVIDVEDYRERRRRNLAGLAKRTADRAVSSGRPIALEPMSPADRRIIHVTLTDDGRVATESSGEGRERRVTIRPVQGAQRTA